MREERRPAAVVAVAPGLALGAERLPAAMLDLDEGGRVAALDEPDLDLGRVGSVAAEVPQVDEPARWLPGGDLAPFVLDAGGRPFVDPAAGPRLSARPRRPARPTPCGRPATTRRSGRSTRRRRGRPGSRPRRRGGSARSPVGASCSRRRAGNGPPPRPRPARDSRARRQRPRRGGGRSGACRVAPRRRGRLP